MRGELAGPEDIEQLTELRLLYLAEDIGETGGAETALRERLPGYFREHLGRDLDAIVLREGKAIVSCALLLTVEKPMSPRFLNGRTGTVLNVYTRPEHRRRGCGRAVMERLLALAREKELCSVELKATEAGVPLYRVMGFADSSAEYRLMKWNNPDLQG